jgi:hypothetical protein
MKNLMNTSPMVVRLQRAASGWLKAAIRPYEYPDAGGE